MTTWDPNQYLRFADHRLRPALDLLARVQSERPASVFDLGCGAGNVTKFLAERWPEARVTGLDSSLPMLEKARAAAPNIAFVQAELHAWLAPEPAGVIYSNAALHWLEGHDTLFPRLMAQLAPSGALAVQMPRNHNAASHRLMVEAAEAGPWRAKLTHVRGIRTVHDADAYYRMLAPFAARIDIWESEFLQVLEGENPVVEWTKGTALRPYLDALDDAGRKGFLAAYAERIAKAYPPQPDRRTLFPFRRIFIVAESPRLMRRDGGVFASPILLLVLATLLWAGNAVVGKLAARGYVLPFTLSFFRWAIAFAIVAPLFWREARATAPKLAGRWPFVVMLSLMSVTYFNTAQYWALTHTTALSNGVILSGMPAVIFLLNWLAGGERATPVQIAGAIFGMAGVLLVATRGSLAAALALEFNVGDLATLSAVIAWGIYAVLFRRLPAGLDQRGLLVFTIGIGCLGTLPFYVWELVTRPAMHVTLESAGIIAYAGIFPSVVSYLFWNCAVERAGANLAGVLFNLTTVFIVLFGLTLLGEAMAWYHAAGLALIFAGIYLAVVRGKLGTAPAKA